MEDKKNPKTNKDENVGIACEPPVSYAATGSGYVNTIESLEEEIGISDDVDSGIGPYSMEELNARIDEAEAAITRSEHGDWSDWVTSTCSETHATPIPATMTGV